MSALSRRLAIPRLKARKGDEMDTAAEILQLAQQAADRAIADAQREAEKILAQARLAAEQIIADARARAEISAGPSGANRRPVLPQLLFLGSRLRRRGGRGLR